MSISSEITRLQNAKAGMKTAIEGKGVTVSSSATLDDYADLIDSISGGGGGAWEDEMTKLLDGSATSINIPSAVTALRTGAFSRYTGLTSAHIPSTVTSIGANAFQYCSALTSVTYDGVPTYTGAVFSYCTAITDIRNVLPSGITTLVANLFERCTGLINVVVPEGVDRVYSNAFYACSNIQVLDFPSTITKIDSQENMWNNVTSIVIRATAPPTLGHATGSLGPTSNTFPIYVPDASVNAYKNAGGNWANYSSRITSINNMPT